MANERNGARHHARYQLKQWKLRNLITLVLAIFLVLLSCEDNKNDQFRVALLFSHEESIRIFTETLEQDPFFKSENIQFLFFDPGDEIDARNFDLAVIHHGDPLLPDTLVKNLENLRSLEIPIIAFHFLNHSFGTIQAFVGNNYSAIGEAQANYLSNLSPRGKYLLIFPDRTSPLIDQHIHAVKERLEALLDSERILLLGELRVDEENQRSLESLVSEYYQDTSTYPEAIITGNDSIAEMLIQILEELQIEQFPFIAGWGAEKNSARSIAEGKLTITLLADPVIETKALLDVVRAYFIDNDIHSEDHIVFGGGRVLAKLVSPFLIDRYNLRQILIESGYYSEEELFQ